MSFTMEDSDVIVYIEKNYECVHVLFIFVVKYDIAIRRARGRGKGEKGKGKQHRGFLV